MDGYIIKACIFFTFSHLPFFFSQHSTYQRMSLQPNESYGLQQKDRSLPAMPLPDLTTLPHEPIHQLTGQHAPYSTFLHSALYINTETPTKRLINLVNELNALLIETGASFFSTRRTLQKKCIERNNHTGTLLGVYMLTLSLFVRHEERTWSLEHSDSILSDSPGIMSSSVGTSKCSSPACMEARARRAAHCGYSDPHRPGLQYGDSFDSLGDSPHSDRWVIGLRS